LFEEIDSFFEVFYPAGQRFERGVSDFGPVLRDFVVEETLVHSIQFIRHYCFSFDGFSKVLDGGDHSLNQFVKSLHFLKEIGSERCHKSFFISLP